jgi:hypothetical protein
MELVVLCWGGFDLFLPSVLRQVPNSSTRWFGDEGLQTCVAWGVAPTYVFSAFARFHCKQRVVFRSSKPCVAMAFAGAPFSSMHFSSYEGRRTLEGRPHCSM